MNYSLKDIAKIVNGEFIGSDKVVNEICFDSRNTKVSQKTVFVSIKSKNRDGHTYISDLVTSHVEAFIVEQEFRDNKDFEKYLKNNIGFVIVDNSIKALQRLALFYRKSLKMPIIAITGSNGKTVTKEWISQLNYNKKIFRSPKSFNSQLGVALSILMIKGNEDFCVIEAGISQTHEMDSLEKIIAPNCMILTNIGSAHGENFESQEQKLAEKLKLAANSDTIIYCKDYVVIDDSVKKLCKKTLTWGVSHLSDIIIKNRESSSIEFLYKNKSYHFTLPYNDDASFENIMNAISLFVYLNIDLNAILERIPMIESVEMRLELLGGINQCRIINDSYSNDINSLEIALNYMQKISTSQEKMVILSDIFQSGISKEFLYKDVESLLNKFGIERLIAIGDDVSNFINHFNGSIEKYHTTSEFCSKFERKNFNDISILIKGSRFFEFEKISTLLQEKIHSTILEVDLEALASNYKYYKSLISPSTKTVAMVKAFAYGSGTYEIASTLIDEGVDYLAVAYIDEGTTLREKGITKPIIILNSNPNDYETMLNYNLEPEIYNFNSLDKFNSICSKKGIPSYPIHIKIDTGMHRVGFESKDINDLCKKLKNSCLIVGSIFSHLSSSDDPTKDFETIRQIDLFTKIYDEISSKIEYSPIRHICNSSGIERFKEAHFEMVRIGIGLYGISSTEPNALKNISSLKSIILQIKEIKKGDYIGYSMKGIAEKNIKTATVSIGYADGLNRLLSDGKWSMKINGHLAPIVGNISMDNCIIDITSIDGVKEGDFVSVFESSDDIIKMAKILNTIPYEILTSISSRIKRRYIR